VRPPAAGSLQGRPARIATRTATATTPASTGLIGCHGRTDALTTRRDPAGDCHGDIPLSGNQASGDGPFGCGTGTSGPTLHMQLAGSARVGPGPAYGEVRARRYAVLDRRGVLRSSLDERLPFDSARPPVRCAAAVQRSRRSSGFVSAKSSRVLETRVRPGFGETDGPPNRETPDGKTRFTR
jgi:hypothetical protein